MTDVRRAAVLYGLARYYRGLGETERADAYERAARALIGIAY